jgi:hypothetical protein
MSQTAVRATQVRDELNNTDIATPPTAGGTGAINGYKVLANFDAQNLVVDTNVLFVNATTNRVGVNNGSPTTALDVTGTVTATAFSGPLTGAVTGNASTATALQTARNINGTSFNGTADITITAAAGTLTGATLNATVTASSLTSLGSLTSLTVLGATSLSTTSGNVTAGASSAGVDSRAAGSITSSASFFLGVLAGDPSTPVAGQLWYNSTDQQFKGRNATSIVILG